MVRLEVTNPNAFRGRQVKEKFEKDGSWWLGFWQRPQGMVKYCHLKDEPNLKAFVVVSH